MKNVNICVFGDSIPYGRVDLEKGGWANRLKIYVENQKLFNKVYNLGIPGDTTNHLLERLENECKVRKHDIIIIQIGTNDASYINSEFKVSMNNFESNIHNIINILSKFTKNIFFLSLLKPNETQTMPLKILKFAKIYFSEKNFHIYNQKIKTIAKNHNLKYINIYDLLNKDDFYDGLHPNAKGHEKIFQTVKQELIKNNFIK